jgi:hypothetical protein
MKLVMKLVMVMNCDETVMKPIMVMKLKMKLVMKPVMVMNW